MLNGSEVFFPSSRDELFIAHSVNPICLPQAGFVPPAQPGCGWMLCEGPFCFTRGWCHPPCSWGSTAPANMANPLPQHSAFNLLWAVWVKGLSEIVLNSETIVRLPMPSQCFEAERLSTGFTQSHMQTVSTRAEIWETGRCKAEEFLLPEVCSFEQINQSF